MRPFKLSDPAAATINEQKKTQAAPLPGKAITHSEASGQPLPHGCEDIARMPAIDWPAAKNDAKPFKSLK